MRLLLFTDTLADVNGVSRFILDMASCARASGCDLRVVTSTRLVLPQSADTAGVTNLRPRASAPLPGYAMLQIAAPPIARVHRLILELRPDMVHVSTPGPVGVAARLACGRLGVPMMATHHTDFTAYVERLFELRLLTAGTDAFLRWFYRPALGVMVRSADYAKRLVELGVACSKLGRIKPGTNIDLFHPRHRDDSIWSRLGVPGDGAKVIYVGRVSVEKNVPMLERAWELLRSKAQTAGAGGTHRPAADLVIVGDGPHRAAMQARLAGQRAHFLGFRAGAELSALYASADLLVFPSTTDTLGQVVMESQASGVPVVVSDQGGPKEVVRDGITGVVLPADDIAAWVEAIAELAADRERRRQMGLAARAWMERHSIHASFRSFWEAHERRLHEHGLRLLHRRDQLGELDVTTCADREERLEQARRLAARDERARRVCEDR